MKNAKWTLKRDEDPDPTPKPPPIKK